MANREELISQFSDVTGVEAERAQFYLESSAWRLDVALASFYENDEPIALENEPLTGSRQTSHIEDISDPTSEPITGSGITEEKSNKSKAKTMAKSKFKTLGDLNKESSSEEEEGQAFYAGGSENSGQQVLGPDKKKDIVSDMFKSCQEHSVALESKAGGCQRPHTFGGTGYKLGQTDSDTEVIASEQGQSNSNTSVVLLKLWRDGFTVNDGDLKLYSEPDNKRFLATIKRGELPSEIHQEINTSEIRLDMEDHRHEEYVPPKPKVKAFTGKGHMLGSPSPATVGMTVPTDPADQAANEAQAKTQLNVDPSKPVTTLQIRLVDGTSVRAQFNLSHTIDDIRQYITTMRPQYALREFSLLTMYPTTDLTENKTIEEAGLQNSSIIQRLK